MLASVLLLAGCTSRGDSGVQQDKPLIKGEEMTITINMPENEKGQNSSEALVLLWEKGDTISLKCYKSEKEDSFIVSDFALVSGDGDRKAKFRGIVPDGCKWFTAEYKRPGSTAMMLNSESYDDFGTQTQQGFNSSDHVGKYMVLHSSKKGFSIDDLKNEINLTSGSYIIRFNVSAMPVDMKDLKRITYLIDYHGMYLNVGVLNFEGGLSEMVRNKDNYLYLCSHNEAYISDYKNLVLYMEGSGTSYMVTGEPDGYLIYRHGNVYDMKVTTDMSDKTELNRWQKSSVEGSPGVDEVRIKTDAGKVPPRCLTTDNNRFMLESDVPADGWFTYKLENFDVATELSPLNDSVRGIITAINLPIYIKRIDNNTFMNCVNLKSVQINSQLESIGSFAFHGCYELQGFDIPEGISSIGSHTFAKCRELKEVILPSSLEWIGEGAFKECVALSELTIPENVRGIDENAFEDTSLRHLRILAPSSTLKDIFNIMPGKVSARCSLTLDESWKNHPGVAESGSKWFGMEFSDIEFH